jgi:tetratricopeptide (TPR) repeat protein
MKTGQVFISHTSDMARFPPGRSFIDAVLDAVGRADMAPVDMRYFAARAGAPAGYCRQRVRECEVYVAVVGFRYGSIVPGLEVSYTELEFDEATAAGRPRLAFLLAGTVGIPGALVDADRRAVVQFRQKLLTAGLLAREFTTREGLELEVFHALRDLPGRQAAVPTKGAVTFSLPPDTPAFTGRVTELHEITTAAGSGGAVAIHAVDGMPGVGKTALAVHAAHLLRDEFPDRQLFVNLHAHTPGKEPVRPEDALAGLLSATGADPRFVPADLDGRAAMWRNRLAGQRAVLVLDNADSSSQVSPLLPGSAGCLVLITSRRHLGDLPGAVAPALLDALRPGEAQEMFTRLAPRAADDPGEVAILAELAGYLPLAISLLARVLARHPEWTLADLAAETRAGLLALTAEHDSIAAAFSVSYQHLDPALQRLFCLLGVHPGTTTDAYAAAALAATSPGEATELLDALHAEGLLTETGHRRYGMHDLLRRYARHHAPSNLGAAGSQQALYRLLDYYQRAATLAETRLARQTRPGPVAGPPARLPAIPPLADAPHALAWARTERASVLACLDHASRAGEHARVIALTAGLAGLLRYDGPWPDAITRHTTAIQAARNLGDKLAQANATSDLAEIRLLTGDYPAAAEALEHALATYREVGDQLGQANALTGLGIVCQLTDNYPGAAQALEQALGSYRHLGDRRGQANALTNLGIARELTGDYPGAAQALEQALRSYRHLGDRRGQANALTDLGVIRRATGDHPGATHALEQALDISRDLGNQLAQANALTHLGAVRQQTGNYPAATQALNQALSIFRDLGDRGGEAVTLNETGTLNRVSGDLAQAQQCHQQALDLARAIASPWDQAHALAGLGRCALTAGHTKEAQALLRQAHQIFQQAGAADADTILAELNALLRTARAE